MSSLSDLELGQKARITGLELPPDDRQRLLEMGLTNGAEVSVVRVAPMGDPLELRIRGYLLSLRRSDAKGVIVEPVSDQ